MYVLSLILFTEEIVCNMLFVIFKSSSTVMFKKTSVLIIISFRASIQNLLKSFIWSQLREVGFFPIKPFICCSFLNVQLSHSSTI